MWSGGSSIGSIVKRSRGSTSADALRSITACSCGRLDAITKRSEFAAMLWLTVRTVHAYSTGSLLGTLPSIQRCQFAFKPDLVSRNLYSHHPNPVWRWTVIVNLHHRFDTTVHIFQEPDSSILGECSPISFCFPITPQDKALIRRFKFRTAESLICPEIGKHQCGAEGWAEYAGVSNSAFRKFCDPLRGLGNVAASAQNQRTDSEDEGQHGVAHRTAHCSSGPLAIIQACPKSANS